MTSADYDLIALKNHVMDERGQYYVINTRQRKRDGRRLVAEISCSHVMFKLADFKVPYASYVKESYGTHIAQLTDKIAAATGGRFSFIIHDTFDLYDVKDWGRTNCLAALNDVIKMYGAEIEADNFTIHIRKKIGGDYGHQYRIGKNVISSVFKDDGSALTTRLFAQMKDGRTWIGQPASILTAEERARLSAIPGTIVNGNLAVNYLVSQYADAWATPDTPFYDAELIDQNITSVDELLRQARKALAENEVPALEIDVDAADIYKLDADETRPGLGDTVYCVDPEMELPNITARITEITEYPFDRDKHTTVTVSNVMGRDFADILADLDRAKRIVYDIVSAGTVRTEVFEAFARQAVIDVNNSKSEVKYDTRGIILQDKTNAANQVVMTANGIMLTTDGGNTARAAITANGIVAERIVGQQIIGVGLTIGSGNNITQINTNGIAAGHAVFSSAPFQVKMNGDVIARSITLTGKIENSDMSASNITGGTITGALLRTAASGARFEARNEGISTFDSGGVERISIKTSNASGMGSINFSKPNGSGAGMIDGSSTGMLLTSFGTLFLGAVGGNVQFQGGIDFTTAGSVYGLTVPKIEGLQSALNGKVSFGTPTGSTTVAAHNHGIPDGTVLRTADGGSVTYRAYSGDTHYHVI